VGKLVIPLMQLDILRVEYQEAADAAFFDDNVTGNLGFLANIVGIFKTEAIGDLNGTFAMWEWK
jgi:hypothetical protein